MEVAMTRRHLAFALLTPLAVAGLGCQAIHDLLPTGATKASPSPTPGVVAALTIPVILPTPKPTPKPTPTPKPAPTPSATPTPTSPTKGSCSLPASNPSNPVCGFDAPQLGNEVESALTKATQTHPEYFDFKSLRCGNCYYVKNVSGYVAEVQKALAAQGVCSLYDGEEMAVKDSNSRSEQYDILLADGHMRRQPSAYRGNCSPALF
jgi:hypothetical protein